jgi:hypothetical protein
LRSREGQGRRQELRTCSQVPTSAPNQDGVESLQKDPQMKSHPPEVFETTLQKTTRRYGHRHPFTPCF